LRGYGEDGEVVDFEAGEMADADSRGVVVRYDYYLKEEGSVVSVESGPGLRQTLWPRLIISMASE